MVGLTIHRQHFVFIAHHIARLTDHAFDIALRLIRWELKYDHFAFFRMIHRHHHVIGDWHTQTVGVFVHQDKITHI